ncbi:MAG: succinate dehydrogenase, cytochrome b556 subunit [Bdellovibrionales bacterium]
MKSRPLSPHLQIYKPQISSVISILHRAAGIVLCGGLVLFAWWLMTAASGAEAYNQFFLAHAITWWGRLTLLGLSFCFYFYFLAEVRYLAWAFGYGFSLPVMNITGWLVVLGTFALTALTWSVL